MLVQQSVELTGHPWNKFGHDVPKSMPVGLQFIAPARAEEKLLAVALAAERVLGTAAERLGVPPMLTA